MTAILDWYTTFSNLNHDMELEVKLKKSQKLKINSEDPNCSHLTTVGFSNPTLISNLNISSRQYHHHQLRSHCQPF